MEVGIVMGRVFSGTRPALSLMGRGSILINEFGRLVPNGTGFNFNK